MPRRYWSFWWAGLGVALMLNVISAFASAAATRTLLLIGAVAWFAAIERGLKSPRVPRPKPFSFYWSAIVFALDVASSALQLTAATNDVLAVVFVVVFATELGFFVVGGLVVVAMWAARRGTSVPVPVPEAVPHAVRGPAATTTTADVEPTKRCPYCGEEILAVARKCKHCGEFLDGTTTGSR